jgi:hypothetical protein
MPPEFLMPEFPNTRGQVGYEKSAGSGGLGIIRWETRTL